MSGADASPVIERGYARVVDVTDFDEITVEMGPQTYTLRLAHVLPLSRWPRAVTQAEQGLSDDAKNFIDKWVLGQTVFVETRDTQRDTQKPIQVDLYRYTFGPSRMTAQWEGKRPSEKVKWFGYNLNLLLIEEGITTYAKGNPPRSPAIRELFTKAEQWAQERQTGMWSQPDFAKKLQDTAIEHDVPDD